MINFLSKNLFVVFVFSVCFLNAQDTTSVVVEYEVTVQKFPQKAFLVSGLENTVFFFSKSSTNKLDNIFDNPKIAINPYYAFFYNNEQKKMYQTIGYDSSTKLSDSIRLSIDDFPKIKWELKNDQKKILGYQCRKAITSFRGRNYEVWYTLELPGNSFPWKFRGLPGLILSFSDDENAFTGDAKIISLNRNVPQEFSSRISTFLNKYKNSAINYKEDISLQNDWLKENRSKEISNLPLGTKVFPTPLRQASIERIFEWEESKNP